MTMGTSKTTKHHVCIYLAGRIICQIANLFIKLVVDFFFLTMLYHIHILGKSTYLN